jgi:hypothetical protein
MSRTSKYLPTELSDDEEFKSTKRSTTSSRKIVSGDSVVLGNNGDVEIVDKGRVTTTRRSSRSPRQSPVRTLYEDEDEMYTKDKSTLLSQKRISKNLDSYGVRVTPLSRDVEEIKQDLSRHLLDLGYNVIDYIVVDGKVFLMLSYNRAGDLLAIRPDRNTGTVYVAEGKKTIVDEVDATIIPNTTITDISKCAINASCGAVAKCNDHYCMINTDNDGTVRHHSFTVKKEVPLGATVTLANSAIGVPLVSLSDIEANSAMVDAVVRKATLNFNSEFVNASKAQLTNMIKEAEILTEQLKSIRSNVDNIISTSEMKTKRLLQKQETLSAIGNKTEKEQVETKKVVDELVKTSSTTMQEKEAITHLINEENRKLTTLRQAIENTKNELYLTELNKGNKVDSRRYLLPEKLNTMSIQDIELASRDDKSPETVKAISRIVTVREEVEV